MRIIFSILFSCSLLCAQRTMFFGQNVAPAGSGISFVNECVSATAQGASSTITCGATIDIAAGNLVVVYARTVGVTSSGVSDGSNTYTSAGSQCVDGATGVGIFYYAKNTSAVSAATITVTLPSPSAFRGMWVGQFSGLSTSAPLDVGTTCTTGVSTAPTTSSFTTASANELLIMGSLVGALSQTYGAGSGYTLGATNPDGDMGTQYKTVASIQTGVTAAMTLGASNPWQASVVTFQ